GGPVIFVGSLVPLLPGDVAGIVAGSVRYPFRRYLALSVLGSMIKMVSIAYLGAGLLTRLEGILEGILEKWAGLLF
ncbi:MAG: VTT domain-containing protein, partial [Dehalococcoidia bacterium]